MSKYYYEDKIGTSSVGNPSNHVGSLRKNGWSLASTVKPELIGNSPFLVAKRKLVKTSPEEVEKSDKEEMTFKEYLKKMTNQK